MKILNVNYSFFGGPVATNPQPAIGPGTRGWGSLL